MTRPAPLIALTGATGFLGSHIADALLAAGCRVRASVRATSSLRWLEGKDLATRELDLGSAADADRLLDGADGVIHCAGVVSETRPGDYERGNVGITRTLLEAAARRWDGVPTGAAPAFVFISSLAAHGPAPLDRPAVESGAAAPITAYGRSKRDAEKEVVRAPGLFRRAILRPPALYGPRDKDFLPLLKMAGAGWTARLGTRMTGLSLVDGRDAAAAAVALLFTPAAEGVFFVDDGARGYDHAGLTAALAAAAGRPVRTLPVPLWPLRALSKVCGRLPAARLPVLNPDRVRDLSAVGWACDGRRLVAVTGFAPRFDAARGLTETMAFCRREGWL
jgi:nucleoside-diphosphate-sugar epimerase